MRYSFFLVALLAWTASGAERIFNFGEYPFDKTPSNFVSAVTGLVLLLSLKRRRVAGLVTAVVGTVALVAVFVWLVP